MFKKLFGQGGGHGGGGGGGGGTSHQGSRQVTATSTQKTVDAIQKLGEVTSHMAAQIGLLLLPTVAVGPWPEILLAMTD